MARAELRQYYTENDREEKDVNYLAKHLETHLKERFNVLLSIVEYGIKDGHLVVPGKAEPFIESIKRGRDVIQKIDSRLIDIERENAEPIGFAKIDSFLADPAAPLNSKMLSISPKGKEGSKYQHNFYDIFTLKEKDGKRYVELSRYSSGLTEEEYAKRLGENYKYPPQANPIKAPIELSPEEVHKLLHIDHDFTALKDFEKKIWTSPLVQYCVNKYQLDRSPRSFNAILNAADEVWENKDRKIEEGKYEFIARDTISYEHVKALEEKKVRQAGGQCPGKSGSDIESSAFSVSDFSSLGSDKYGERAFKCPKCGKTNIRPEGELLANCQHCGSNEVSC
jgi:hypothetical protein